MKFHYKKQPVKAILIFFVAILSVQVLRIFCNELLIQANSFVTNLLVHISSQFSFSAGDLFYTVLIIFLVILSLKIIRLAWQKNGLKLKAYTGLFFYIVTCFYVIFHLFWGFNYYKKPIKDAYDTEKIETDELKPLAEIYLEKCVSLRQNLDEDKNGVFHPVLEISKTEDEIGSIRKILIKKYPEIKFNSVKVSNLKSSLYSEIFSYLGVLGYYVPFTAESQFNDKMPYTKSLFTQFHETAHLWGFAPENEANFIGFLIGIESEDPNFQYAANYKALKSILHKIVWEDPVYVEGFIEKYSDGMKRDRDYEKQIQRKYHHSADDAFSVLNEAYLRLNNQDGLDSYGKFVELLVGFHRKYPE